MTVIERAMRLMEEDRKSFIELPKGLQAGREAPYVTIRDERGRLVANLSLSRMGLAVAMAAAPELLEALDDLVNVGHDPDDAGEHDHEECFACKAERKARAAIAKARGNS